MHANRNHWYPVGRVEFSLKLEWKCRWEWDGNGNGCDGNGISIFTMTFPFRSLYFQLSVLCMPFKHEEDIDSGMKKIVSEFLIVFSSYSDFRGEEKCILL